MRRSMKRCCVTILSCVARPQAYSLLLGLGLSEADAVGSSSLVKCMRALNKHIGDHDKANSNSTESEVVSVLEVILRFVKQVYITKRPLEGSKAMSKLWEGAREVAEAARRANPEIA